MNTDLVNIIFGMKVRQARLENKLNLTEFADLCELSPSYITEIEKGRKYPKTDKILRMAHVLGKDYNDLVSTKLAPSLTSLETMLASHLLQQFPFEEFGLEVNNLVSLFVRAPNRASALARTIIEIGRQFDVRGEHFLRAALRAYQEIHDNYFVELERAADKFAKRYDLQQEQPLSLEKLQSLIQKRFNYELVDDCLATHPILNGYRSVFIAAAKPSPQPRKLLINAALRPRQVKFVLARELGYQYLKLKERANTSAPDRVDSFQQVLNDYKASYFAGALLMPQAAILSDLREFFAMQYWQPDFLLHILDKYHITPEMLLYRLSSLIPKFFNVRIHFLRFNNAHGGYQLIKQLNMNELLLPSGTALDEHHCRRWLAVSLLREMAAAENRQQFIEKPLVGVQKSQFLQTREKVLSFGFARPLALSPEVGSSVTIGFSITPELPNTIRFVEDPSLEMTLIHDTCERCPLTQAECGVRAAKPHLYEAEQRAVQREAALNDLIAKLSA